MPTFIINAIGTAVVLVLSTCVYRLFFHPLANVPGPKFAAITRLWLAWHLRQGKATTFMPGLHKKYGRIVRISPNEVMICSEEVVRTAYGAGSPFIKGEWYQVCSAPDARSKGEDHFDLLTETDKNRYRLQRRAIGPAYSIAGIEKHQDALDDYLDTFVSRIKSFNGSSIDLADWMHIFALDSLSTVTLSKSPDYTSAGNDGGNMIGSDKHWAYFTVVGLFPWVTELTQRVPKIGMFLAIAMSLVFGLSIPTGLSIFSFAVPNIMERLSQAQSLASVKLPEDRPGLVMSDHSGKSNGKSSSTTQGEEKDLLASLMKLHASKEERFRPSWVLGITLTNFGAGHDTMTITLTALLYHLGRNPPALQRLVAEVRAAGIDSRTSYSEIVQKVPYSMACLKESIRLIPAIGISMPRVVPPGGATLSDTYLPAGTIVGVHPWALHHDDSIYPEADQFRPERWLFDGSAESKQRIGRMDASWLGFGGGSRSCPGQHLARVFVVKCCVRLLCEFDLEVKGTPKFQGWFSVHMKGVEASFKAR